MSSIPEYQSTPIDAVPKIASSLRYTFASNKTKPIEWRLKQLRKLYWALKDNEQAMFDALHKDLRKSTFESYQSEVGWVIGDVLFVCENLEKWAKDEPAPDLPLMWKPLNARIRKDPLGCVLILGTYNFPIQLTFGPLIGAIAAGCTAVLKPSESAPYCAAITQKIIEDSLDLSAYACVQGAVPEATALLDCKWDKIFYTGGLAVAKIIAKKAAETLTPVTLELGGRNPAIVTKNADMRLAAKRLLWGKNMNAGQVCISQNYVMIEESMLTTWLSEFKRAYDDFYPNGAKASPDYARIINQRQFQRLKGMLERSEGRILFGGSMDEDDLFIEPTVVQVSSENDALLVDESFGPLIPVLPVKDLDSAIRIANEVSGTPLGIYPFGSKAETDRVLNETRSGGASVNDSFFHGSISVLPFGGVGESGQGSYRGRASFECFVHRRTVVTTPGWMDIFLDVRYPPYTAKKMKQYRAMSEKTPDFDRDGNVKSGMTKYILRLGSNSLAGAMTKWMTAALIAIALRRYTTYLNTPIVDRALAIVLPYYQMFVDRVYAAVSVR